MTTTTTYPDRARVDAADKVAGRTRYSADLSFDGLLHGMIVPARIARGTVTAVNAQAASAIPGVVRILTPDDMSVSTGEAFPPPPPVLQSEILYRGQPVAFAVARTLEAAIEAAEAVEVSYDEESFDVTFEPENGPRDEAESMVFGDADAAFERAETRIEATYSTLANHHNPMELLSTTAVWSGERLTIYEGTQGASGAQLSVANILGIDPDLVDIVSAQVGGGFGQKGWPQVQTAIVAAAARLVGQPVKLVLPRYHVFHNATFRPASHHRVRLGADAEGRIIAADYDVVQQNSRNGFYPAGPYHAEPTRLYGTADYRGTTADVRLDTQNPAHMRAPYPHLSCFAYESAVDELAAALGRDPVELRLANDTRTDPVTGNPLSSRHLNRCLERGAEMIGWSRRTLEPGSMARYDGTLVGYGVAAGTYESSMHPAVATLSVGMDGRVRYAASGHEMGQGIRSAIAQALIGGLRIDPERLEITLADTRAVPQHLTAGSWGTASAVPLAEKAAREFTSALDALLEGRDVPGDMGEQLARIRRPSLAVEVNEVAPGQGAEDLERMRSGGFASMGPDYPDFTTMSYIAHFAEVHVDPHTRRIRVPRFVTVADCGRVISPRTAKSQVYGGVVWGIGAALQEASEVDERYGGWLNSDIAEYVIPVNADIGSIEVELLDEPDPLANASGVKGIGEVAMVGVAAAIANAVHHATGRRLRALPMRLDHLIG